MRLYNIRGRLIRKRVFPYLIAWDGPSKSKIQFQVKQFLKPYWSGHICYEEFPVYGSLLQVDFVNATLRIGIEVQGPQHEAFHYFHGGEPLKYLEQYKHDVQKREWLERNEFRFIEINYDEVDSLTVSFFKEKFNVTL